MRGQLLADETYYLHVIELVPQFHRLEDINQATLYDCYSSDQCFGLITCNMLPNICDFPIYVKLGQIDVSLKINQKKIVLNEEQLMDIKRFHTVVFRDVLKVLQPFLIFDNSPNAEILLLAPINKMSITIDFDVLKNMININPVTEPSPEQKLSLEVTTDTYLKKIVYPWYRPDSCWYIVTEVCLSKSAYTPFPNEDFSNFQHYFNEKHNLSLMNPDLPLLLVKGITKQLNFIKQRGIAAGSKRRRDDLYEEMIEYLVPELLIKQEFPSNLWIQASFLPTILSRVVFCLRLEEFRSKIASDTGVGHVVLTKLSSLQLIVELSDYKDYLEDDEKTEELPSNIIININDSYKPSTIRVNKDVSAKKLEAQYPWKDVEEPKDIERESNVTVMDIDYYEVFLNRKVDDKGFLLKNESPTKSRQLLALTYYKNYAYKPIKMLEPKLLGSGPDLCEMYQALTANKANDIVNLERLETLGDSFLKYIATAYIFVRFPNYDEGRATSLKGRLISNKNLYYLAKSKNIGGIMNYHGLSPKEEWLPPSFTIPSPMEHRIKQKEISLNALFNLYLSDDEQVSGILTQDTIEKILQENYPIDDLNDDPYVSMAPFLKSQYISDKNVADVVESLLGVYFQSCGISGEYKLYYAITLLLIFKNYSTIFLSIYLEQTKDF